MAADRSAWGASLDAVVNFDSVVCLNEASDHPAANLFCDEANELSSDADQQLLLHIPFVEPVHLVGLRLVASGEPAPASVKLFLNQPNFGFDDAETEAAAHELSPHFENAPEALMSLPPSKFRSVHTLTLFVEDNFGADVTKIRRLELYGSLARGGTPGAQHTGSSRQQRKAASGSKSGVSDVIKAAEVASRLGSQSSDGLSRVLLELVSKVGQGRGRNLVRRATQVHLAAATGEGDRRRRALLAVGAAARLLGGPVEQNDGAWRGIRVAAGQGLMAALETSAHEQLWTLQELMARGLPAGATLQLLRAGARAPATGDEAALRTLLQSLCSAEGARPRDALLAGQWIADGLQDPEGGLQELCQGMAADFATQLANRGAVTEARDRPGWCAAAADALGWLPPSLCNDGLQAMAAQAPKAAPRRGREDPTSADAQRDAWSIDLHSLPCYQLPGSVSVTMVDTKQSLQAATSQLFAETSTVGVDTEWGNDSDLSLVQLATENSCFLVDVGAFAMDATLKAGLVEALETAFSRPVVAWSFREDARRLARLHEPLQELLPLVNDLQPQVRMRLGLPQPPSLQRACAELLGAAMDKTHQRSAWDQRPLSEAQMNYAACDARVLLDIARRMREEEEEDE